MAKIHEQLRAAQDEIGFIPKSHENKGVGGGYSFRSVEDALNVAGPILRKHGITCVPRVIQHATAAHDGRDKFDKPRTSFQASVLMEMDFIAEDDSKVTVSMAGEGMDFGGDKATSKSLSQAFKYCIFLGLQVPVEQGALDDSDRQDKRRKRERQPAASNGASSAENAVSAIVNAVSLDVLDRYEKAAEGRIKKGDWTEQEISRVKLAINQSRTHLMQNSHGMKTGRNLVKSNVIKAGCPEDLVDEFTSSAMHAEDPTEYIKSKPWEAATAK